MYKTILATVAALAVTMSPAFAQTATGTGTATASSGSSSNAGALASAQSGPSVSSVYIDQSTPGIVRSENTTRVIESGTKRVITEQDGTVTNKFAPAVAAPSMGSGHPCGLGNSIGVSIIGGGVTGGATRVDDACLLAQMGYGPAAMQMIAARNPSACKALVASGAISAHSYCGEERPNVFARGPGVYKQPSVAPLRRGEATSEPVVLRGSGAGNAAPPLPQGAAVQSSRSVCMLKPGTTRTVITNAPTQQAKLACAASLGVRG